MLAQEEDFTLCFSIWREVGVTKAIENLKNEVERDMKLMGVTKINQLNRSNLRFK